MKPKIAVIVSSTRPTRAGRHVADWFIDRVKDNEQLNFELIDLKEVDLPFLSEPESPSSGNYTQEKTKAWSKTISDFDGFVFVTAEYNHGAPAPLKNAIDSVYHEWNRKPVAFVGYGTYAATSAVEQLVDTVAKIGMVPLSKTFVGIIKSWEAFTENGTVKPEYVVGNIDGLIDNLAWWTKTLKAARD